VAFALDLTEQKRAEAEIRALKDQLYRENIALREEINHISMFEEIVGSSEALRRVLSQLTKVAPSDSTVLITGESGTGKELIARAIHKRSKRAGRAFIGVNCAAIPGSLVASELFGHEKGHLRVPHNGAWVVSKRQMVARSSWMRLATSLRIFKSHCYECCKNERLNASAATHRSPWT